jgi:acyl-coenzyme A synthetase/AMP-(fatty) acid ligase
VAAYKQLSEVHLVEELPRLPTGKLLRRALRERLGSAAPA